MVRWWTFPSRGIVFNVSPMLLVRIDQWLNFITASILVWRSSKCSQGSSCPSPNPHPLIALRRGTATHTTNETDASNKKQPRHVVLSIRKKPCQSQQRDSFNCWTLSAGRLSPLRNSLINCGSTKGGGEFDSFSFVGRLLLVCFRV